MQRLVNWIEIPVADMARAKAFYGALFGVELAETAFGPLAYAIFPTRAAQSGGALVCGPGHVPGAGGPLIYLDAGHDVAAMLERAVRAGAEVAMPVTHLSEEAGWIAMICDPEGNRIGLHMPTARLAAGPVPDGVMQGLLAEAVPEVAVLLRRGPAHDAGPEGMALQWAHAKTMFTQMRDGALRQVMALMDGSDVLGVAVVAGPAEEARALFAADPAVQAGRLVAEVLTAVRFDAAETRPRLWG